MKIWIVTFVMLIIWNVQHRGLTILTVKVETRHPVERRFGSEFPSICNHCGVMTAWSRKDLEMLWAFFGRTIPLKLSLLRWLRPKSASASPHIWLTLLQISSKLVHFWRSYCWTC